MKPFGELEFCDGFLFAATLEDEELCRSVLERILEIPVKAVKVHKESMIAINPEYRGIRMDVYADDEAGTIYDVEMQTTAEGNLPRRSRCYRGQMDVAALEPGDNVNKLPRSFVIFICTFDPFGDGLYRYTYENTCRENGRFLADGATTVFLNTRGKSAAGVSQALIDFLCFVESSWYGDSVGEDQLLQKLCNRIRYLKRSRRMEERYMLFGELLDKERREGREEGRKEGKAESEAELLSLMKAMIEDDRQTDLLRLQADPDFLEAMKVRYSVSSV